MDKVTRKKKKEHVTLLFEVATRVLNFTKVFTVSGEGEIFRVFPGDVDSCSAGYKFQRWRRDESAT
jgi:hypothetical protein